MTKYLACTNSEETSDTIAAYLTDRVRPTDTVLIMNSLLGGERTSTDTVQSGKRAIDALTNAFPDDVTTEQHQVIRGNEPTTDIMTVATDEDVDEIVIGVQKRNPTGKAVFGSTSQDVLLSTDRPVLAIPLSR